MALIIICSLIGVGSALYVFRAFAGETGARMRVLSLVGIGVFSLAVLASYAVNASPGQPGEPYQARMEAIRALDPALLTLEQQEERLRDLVRANRDDAEALGFLGRFLARTGRELEAISYLERAVQVEPSPRVFSDLGQALVMLNEGQITPEAERAFVAALDLDPAMAEPGFFLGAAAYERGDRDQAASIWSDTLNQLDPDSPAHESIAARAADLLSRPRIGPVSSEEGGTGGAPFADAIENGADPEELIAGMLAGLNAQLSENPDDLSGWLILARAQIMQDSLSQARDTVDRARVQFAQNTGALAMIDSLATVLDNRELEE